MTVSAPAMTDSTADTLFRAIVSAVPKVPFKAAMYRILSSILNPEVVANFIFQATAPRHLLILLVVQIDVNPPIVYPDAGKSGLHQPVQNTVQCPAVRSA